LKYKTAQNKQRGMKHKPYIMHKQGRYNQTTASQSHHHLPNFSTTTDTQYQFTMPSNAAMEATHHAQALLAEILGIPGEFRLPAPYHYQISKLC
jgi:hypothetical protein